MRVRGIGACVATASGTDIGRGVEVAAAVAVARTSTVWTTRSSTSAVFSVTIGVSVLTVVSCCACPPHAANKAADSASIVPRRSLIVHAKQVIHQPSSSSVYPSRAQSRRRKISTH